MESLNKTETGIETAVEELMAYVNRFLDMRFGIGDKLAQMLWQYHLKFRNSAIVPLRQEEISGLALYAMDLIDGQKSDVGLTENQEKFADDIRKITQGNGAQKMILKAGISAAKCLKRGTLIRKSKGESFKERFINLCHRNGLYTRESQERVLSQLWLLTIQKISR